MSGIFSNGESGSVPTGTGFIHVTSGTQDSAARAVNLASGDVTGALAFTNLPQSVLGAVVGQFHIARCVATSNITLSNTQIIDGVSTGIGDRVLAQNQSTASQNGMWIVQSGTWTRPVDWNSASGSPPVQGNYISVSEGTVNANTLWHVTTAQTITVDTTSVAISQFSGGSSVTWANDLAGSTNTSQVVVAATGSAGIFLVRSTAALAFNANYASVGTIRMPTTVTALAARNAANSADLSLVATDGSNNAYFGGSSSQTVEPVNTYLQATTGINLVIGSTTEIALSSTFATYSVPINMQTNYVEFGTNPAGSADIRAANATTVAAARNAGNTADLSLVSTDASNNAYFGGSSAQTLEASNTYVEAASGVNCVVGAVVIGGYSAGLGWLASGNNFSIGNQTPTMNSATNTMFAANASVATAFPSSGIYFYANSGAVEFQTSGGRIINFQS